MILECSTIILLILLMAFMMFRSERGGRGYGVAILPLIIVPAMHVIGYSLAPLLSRMLSIQLMTARAGIEVCGLMACCLLLGAISTRMKKRTRWMYLVICGGFSAILTCVLLIRTNIL